jgi:archaetidylinositol phosphate synthase
MNGTSWTHLLSRPLVRPLIGTRVRPNHITSLRLIFGIAACGAFAWGGPQGMGWGGGLWLVSAFLDRADGELARLGKLMSPGGHLYDYYADVFVNALFFVAIGVGLRHGWLAHWSMPLGLLTGGAIFLSSIFAEWLEQRSPPGTRAYPGKWGFDPDDALYLMAPLAWLGWLSFILVGSAIGATLIMILTGVRLLRLQRASASARA